MYQAMCKAFHLQHLTEALWFGEEKAGGQDAVRMWNLWQVTWFISCLHPCDLGHYLLPVWPWAGFVTSPCMYQPVYF